MIFLRRSSIAEVSGKWNAAAAKSAKPQMCSDPT